MKSARIYMHQHLAGILTEDSEGYHFQYDTAYLELPEAEPISLTLPLSSKEYSSALLFPFFDGLIPEGWLLDIAEKNWKLNPRDRMGILLATCRDCIGAVSVIAIEQGEEDGE
ncbi:HipA N-terminal domain-containing protein [Rufibacter psychrotolerans]|uniref:HipA N-terminal domain-containing protein n=1 Tax=Rufibacter psychrotolerans TaxID=2812556 RepID=UPI00196834A9|nr:HipA N-terminal domain-containing protein [Rufibacter sp. SYSU D00308]